jgi:hypothetical protein
MNAAPGAMQVGDRFHRLANLTTAAERALEQMRMNPPAESDHANQTPSDQVD